MDTSLLEPGISCIHCTPTHLPQQSTSRGLVQTSYLWVGSENRCVSWTGSRTYQLYLLPAPPPPVHLPQAPPLPALLSGWVSTACSALEAGWTHQALPASSKWRCQLEKAQTWCATCPQSTTSHQGSPAAQQECDTWQHQRVHSGVPANPIPERERERVDIKITVAIKGPTAF